MAQYTYIRDSFLGKTLEFLFGSYGITSAFFIPSYIYEGDAVLTETLLSDAGRGRDPGFERGLRTILLNDKDYSFSKALLQSGRDYVPNYYVLGYYLITHLKREYGTDILPEMINFSSNYVLPLNFSTASLLATGKTIPSHYNDVKNELYEKWSEQDSKITPTSTEKVVLDNLKGYVSRTSYRVLDEKRVLYIEQSLNTKSLLIEKNNNKRVVHINIPKDFSTSGNNVLYVSKSSDSRWGYEQYSDIYRYNLESKKVDKLTENQRFLTAQYSGNGNKIAVIDFSKDRIATIKILNSTSMEVLQAIPFKEGDVINSISWSNNNKLIISKISDKGNSLGILDLETEIYDDITAVDKTLKTKPQVFKNYLIYVSTYSGIENINSVNMDTKEIFQVVSSRFGVDYPEVFNDELYFSQYNVNGYNIEKVDLNTDAWIPLEYVENNHVDYFEPLLADVIIPGDENINYEFNSYNPNMNLLDIHSWVVNPFLPTVIKSEVYNSTRDTFFNVQELLLFSTDHLDYMDANFYLHYNISQKSADIGSYGVYRGFYPIIGWDFNLYSENISGAISSLNSSLNFTLPLNFYRDNNSSSLSIGFAPGYYVDLRDNATNVFSLSYYVNYGFNSDCFDINSTVGFNHVINSLSPSVVNFKTNLMALGFFKSDNFNIFNSTTWSIRSGFSPLQSVTSFDYNIPLLYPDLNILNWAYFSSVDLNIGYDNIYTKGQEFQNKVNATLKLNYYLLRVSIEWYTSFEYYYDFNLSEFDYTFTPIEIETSL